MERARQSSESDNPFHIHSIIFDFKRTLYDPETKTLMSGAVELLTLLQKQNIPLFLIAKGSDEIGDELKRLGIDTFFSGVILVQGNKDPKQFEPYVNPDAPNSTLIIGDRTRSELAVGKRLHATTIWVRQGKFAHEEPLDESEKPDYITSSLFEVKKLYEETFGFTDVAS